MLETVPRNSAEPDVTSLYRDEEHRAEHHNEHDCRVGRQADEARDEKGTSKIECVEFVPG